MILKIAGVLLIVIPSAIIGAYYSFKYGYRISDLMQMKKALTILKSEIEFSRSELSEAFANIADRILPPVGNIFCRASQSLEKKTGEPAGVIWNEALKAASQETYFSSEDMDIFYSFGKTAGYLDINLQINSINLCIEYIDQKIEALNESNGKNKRLYQSLGLLSGLLISVVLL